MIAFASNSLLCRSALKQTHIDPASFTLLRMVSGAVALWLLVKIRHQSLGKTGNWPSAIALFVYAAGFSFAYVELPAGTGALLLFGAVQATMILWGFREGERFQPIQIAGILAALAGLVLLLLPGLAAPPLFASVLMLTAGVAWGVYSLRGKSARDVIATTAGNFAWALPLAVILTLITIQHTKIDRLGAIYAVISGAVTSGLGYLMWYSALPRLKSFGAATVQLSVPILAATGGILLLGEPITLRYVLASISVLGGIALVVLEKNQVGRENETVSPAAR